MLPSMEPNRNTHSLPGRLVHEIFHGFGENDSIVDRLLALPVVTPSSEGKPNAWDSAMARRMEKLLADRMREEIEAGRQEN
jgi:hypothetical protein